MKRNKVALINRMSCNFPQPLYTKNEAGLKLFGNVGDGKMSFAWIQAFPDPPTYKVAYNIYYSSIDTEVINDGVKFVSISPGLNATITDFTPDFNAQKFSPGRTYYSVIRATVYDPNWYNINLLPQDEGQNDPYLFVYPESLLTQNIDNSTLIIPLSDVSIFPAYGIIQVGYELIRYIGKDLVNNNLLASERGYLNTNIRFHDVDGYDGYAMQDPVVRFFKGYEDNNLFIISEQCKFTDPNIPFTDQDGYRNHNLIGVLTTDNSVSDAHLVQSPVYDHAGWRRTDPKTIFNGSALDSYIGGENFCADSKLGINRQVRGISLEYQALRREEELLTELGTGEQCILLSRIWNGITCKCMEINQENPDARCPMCYGTGFIGGYNQAYNPRSSDGRIPVKFGPADEDLKRNSSGLESSIIFNCWCLGDITLRDSDYLVRFNLDGSIEYIYEVLDVTRNKLLYSQYGNQHFKAQRVVKTDLIYTFKLFNNTEFMPRLIQTTVGLMKTGMGAMIPHVHDIKINENIVSINQINEVTGMSNSHNHRVENGVILPTLFHSHNIILP